MRRTLTLLVWLAAIPVGAAFADDDCSVPMADWQPREAVVRLARENGWTVRRIRTDDGCYEVKGSDAHGREFKAKIDPATLRVLKVSYKVADKDRVPPGTDDLQDAAPVGPSVAPPNDPFGNGAPPKVEMK